MDVINVLVVRRNLLWYGWYVYILSRDSSTSLYTPVVARNYFLQSNTR